ncbi:Abi-alpha family protein [Mycolicibacterium bacteremicum]|uniref:Abi-alpha family protein n=1 Tax=Mycolicibacterium bacteremicum TaxID=564198 RepID=UPI00350E3BAC
MTEQIPHHGPVEVPADVPLGDVIDSEPEAPEIPELPEPGVPDEPVQGTVTDKAPVKRNGFNRRGFRLATPIGDIAIAVRTPKQRPIVPKWFDPLGITDRAVDAAKTGLKLAAWGEEQVATYVKNRLESVDAAPRPLPQPEPSAHDSLHTKLGLLLDRALDQSTAGSQQELYHRLLDQLVADEARIIGALSDGASSPLVNIHSRSRNQVVLKNACLIGRTANVALPNMVPQYVDHLLSLGLVETGPEDSSRKADYEVLMAEPMVLKAIKGASKGPLIARTEKLSLRLSTLGKGLWAAAVANE